MPPLPRGARNLVPGSLGSSPPPRTGGLAGLHPSPISIKPDAAIALITDKCRGSRSPGPHTGTCAFHITVQCPRTRAQTTAGVALRDGWLRTNRRATLRWACPSPPAPAPPLHDSAGGCGGGGLLPSSTEHIFPRKSLTGSAATPCCRLGHWELFAVTRGQQRRPARVAQVSEVTARPSPWFPGVNVPPRTSKRLSSHSRPVGVFSPTLSTFTPFFLTQYLHNNLCAHLMPPWGSLLGSGAGSCLRGQCRGQAGVRATPRGEGLWAEDNLWPREQSGLCYAGVGQGGGGGGAGTC